MHIRHINNSDRNFAGIHVANWLPGDVKEDIENHEIFRANAKKYDISFDRYIFDYSVKMTVSSKRDNWVANRIFNSFTEDLTEFVRKIKDINTQEAFDRLLNGRREIPSKWNAAWKRFLKIR